MFGLGEKKPTKNYILAGKMKENYAVSNVRLPFIIIRLHNLLCVQMMLLSCQEMDKQIKKKILFFSKFSYAYITMSAPVIHKHNHYRYLAFQKIGIFYVTHGSIHNIKILIYK